MSRDKRQQLPRLNAHKRIWFCLSARPDETRTGSLANTTSLYAQYENHHIQVKTHGTTTHYSNQSDCSASRFDPWIMTSCERGRGTDWCRALWVGNDRLVVLFGQKAQDVFAHAEEVDDLSDAEERRDDQSSTVRALQESSGTFVA